jgi:serine protease Do
VSRGYLGIQTQDVNEDVGKSFGVEADSGALVSQVYENTPSAAAGMKRGDVISTVDGEKVKDANALIRAVGTRKPGEKLALGIVRDSKPMTLEVKLAERPAEDADPGNAPTERKGARSHDPNSKLGVTLRPISPQVKADLGVPGGVTVEGITESSPAQGFLRPGDVILEVNRWPVTTPEDVDTLLQKANGTALFLIQRGDAQQFVAVPIGK